MQPLQWTHIECLVQNSIKFKGEDFYKPLLSPAIFVFEGHPLALLKQQSFIVMTTGLRNVTIERNGFPICLEDIWELNVARRCHQKLDQQPQPRLMRITTYLVHSIFRTSLWREFKMLWMKNQGRDLTNLSRYSSLTLNVIMLSLPVVYYERSFIVRWKSKSRDVDTAGWGGGSTQ